MAKKSLKEISKKMRHLDFCMMTTIGPRGMQVSRPMSNNGDVEYDGSSYFFAFDDSEVVKDLKKNKNVNLSFSGPKRLFLSVAGKGKVIAQKAMMQEHWVKDLDRWFEDGVDTDGVVMIEVKAKMVKYWQDEESGEREFKN